MFMVVWVGALALFCLFLISSFPISLETSTLPLKYSWYCCNTFLSVQEILEANAFYRFPLIAIGNLKNPLPMLFCFNLKISIKVN